MTSFLLEIYGEEIPSWAQRQAENQLMILFKEFLAANQILFSEFQSFSTSRRISLIIKKIKNKVSDEIIEIRGPAVGSNEKAIEGFLKKNHSKVNDLVKKKTKGKEYFFLLIKTKRLTLNKLFEKEIPLILKKIRWKKSMRWNSFEDRWIRPIKNIMCILEKERIEFEYGGVKSTNYTFGNYHFDKTMVKIDKIEDYEKKLKDNLVIVSRAQRQKVIANKLDSFCKNKKLDLIINEELFEKVSDSVEYPFVLFANFSKSYFDLPEFLIKSVMTEKQEYFCFMNKARLSNNFAFVSSKNDSNSKLIVKGNQNVLKARFSDAKFFIAEDKKKTLKERLEILKKVIFFTNAGTLHQRALRIKKLNIFISKQINFNIRKFEKYLALSNADLTSELVKEFPGLQGKVGGYYASLEKIPNEVCEAFYNQYNSKFPKKSNNILALIISISQKIDGILAFFISQKRISGAGDPFGLRRSVLSIIKICIDNKLSLDINLVIKFSLKTFEEQKIKNDINVEDILNFLKKRFMNLFTENGYSNEQIETVLFSKCFNPYELKNELKVLKSFINSQVGINFQKAFKRLSSIKEEKSELNFDIKIFQCNEEFSLYKCSQELKSIQVGLDFLNNKKFIILLTNSLNNFFDKVQVNSKEKKLKKNRKSFVNFLYREINNYFNFEFLIK